MCMEDIRLGRKTMSRVGFTNITSTGNLVIGPNPRRVALCFFSSQTRYFTISNNNPTTLFEGITIGVSGSPILLNIKDHGNCVCKAWYGIASAGSDDIGWIEAELVEE